MSTVSVPFGESARDTATLLLAAVEEMDDFEPGSVVADTGNGTFTVPEEVAKKAGVDTVDLDADLKAAVEEARKNPELPSQSVTNEEAELKSQARAVAEPAPAKKAAAKKAPAKRTASKTTAAKKTAAKKSTAKGK